MKYTIRMALCFAVTTLAFGQQPIKVNLLDYFDKVTPPPASAKAAYEKCDWNLSGRKIADSMFKSLENELEKFQASISIPAGSAQEDMATKMKDPEFKKKMKTMSKEEKMKMAMQMSQNMQPGQMRLESEAVNKVMQDCSQLTEESTRNLGSANDEMKRQAKRVQDLEASHKAVDQWESAEIDKLPRAGGEGVEHDPKAVAAVRLKAINKHIAVVDEDLKQIGKAWADTKAKSKQQFAEYEADLEKIHFGDDAQNNTSKTQISTGQSKMIGALSGLVRDSKNSYLDAAPWYKKLVDFQKVQVK
jgi:hypothetical protein